VPVCPLRRLSDVQASLTEAENLFRKGVTLGDEGKWAEASESFSAAVAADLNHSGASCRLGFAEYKKAGKHCEASFEPLTRCLELNPTTDSAAYVNLAGVLRYVRRDVDGAERLLRSALELDPGSPNAHGVLSELLEQERGDLDGAITEMEDCLRCGGIPGFEGEACLASLNEKKRKAHHVEVHIYIPEGSRTTALISIWERV
jgi:tetratricopeptide (TPR) repeat protein